MNTAEPLLRARCATQEHHEEVNACKKPRVTWSVEMHQKFVAAVNQLGVDSEC